MKISTNNRSNNVHTQRTPPTRLKALDKIYKIYTYASLGEKNRIENEIMKMYTNKKYSTEKAE